MSKTLRLVFRNTGGTSNTFSLTDPIEPVDPVAVNDAMDTVINTNIFTSSGGDLVGKVRAELVTREVETIAEF